MGILMKVLTTIRNIFFLIGFLLFDFMVYVLGKAKSLLLTDNILLHSFVWYFYVIFRRGNLVYNHYASYNKSDVAKVKNFIIELDKAVNNKTFVLSDHRLSINSGDNFWISNKWYANEVQISGKSIYPRKSELNTLINLYKKARLIS